jgi:ABC-type antimicrobial peptide transport system permease subunit
VRTVNEQIDRGLVTERLIAELTAFFGVLALILCAIGLYGVMSYSIARRTSEIGVRMALGASSHGVLRMVMREALALAGLGVLIGLPCSLICGRLAAGRLYGITPADPLSIGAAVLVIAVSAALAAYVPARRATRVDPMSALRCD